MIPVPLVFGVHTHPNLIGHLNDVSSEATSIARAIAIGLYTLRL